MLLGVAHPQDPAPKGQDPRSCLLLLSPSKVLERQSRLVEEKENQVLGISADAAS